MSKYVGCEVAAGSVVLCCGDGDTGGSGGGSCLAVEVRVDQSGLD